MHLTIHVVWMIALLRWPHLGNRIFSMSGILYLTCNVCPLWITKRMSMNAKSTCGPASPCNVPVCFRLKPRPKHSVRPSTSCSHSRSSSYVAINSISSTYRHPTVVGCRCVCDMLLLAIFDDDGWEPLASGIAVRQFRVDQFHSRYINTILHRAADIPPPIGMPRN